ncbi:MAG: DUF5682 family protein, partial [Oscillospiraceae bacterium]|nr:DUF5682 family protein [Oscillospiraceae bacterium]
MERTVYGMQRIERINFFGVRHFSPAASYHLEKLLDEVKPQCVLVEGPDDANRLIREVVRSGVKPPVAILSYTAEIPVSTVIYPFAEYSPEYRAILWAVKNGAEVRFIDLPTGVWVRLEPHLHVKQDEDEATEKAGNDEECDDDSNLSDEIKNRKFNIKYRHLYKKIVKNAGESDYDDYWERMFEHNLNPGSYGKTVVTQSNAIRQLTEDDEMELIPNEYLRNFIRESYMKRRIADAAAEYGKIVVVTGAFHTEGIKSDVCKPMTDEEIALLPARKTNLTLMPYTSYRLSERSGYGAGNKAPEYFQLMWECMNEGRISELPYVYMSSLSKYIRENGGSCSTA